MLKQFPAESTFYVEPISTDPGLYQGTVQLKKTDRWQLRVSTSVTLFLTPDFLTCGENLRVCQFTPPLDISNPIRQVLRNANHTEVIVVFTNSYEVFIRFDPQQDPQPFIQLLTTP